MTTRRRFLQTLSTLPALSLYAEQSGNKFPPIRQLTRGPKFHWFAYYDKLQFSPDDRYVLCNQSDFENRSPTPDDAIKVGMIDLKDGDKWIELGESRAWNWQQGCMLQWIPGSENEVLWNDREGDHYICHILNVQTGKKRTIPNPIYALSPDGTWAISTSFSRLADMRPGYGYAGVPDAYADKLAPEETGIFRVDLKTGEQKLLISLADVVKFPFQSATPDKDKHWFNHLLINPDGTRFVFLHRWRTGDGPHLTHMISAAADGSDVRVLIGTGFVSHFYWRDATHMLAYSKAQPLGDWGFFLFEDKPNGGYEEIGKGILKGDGHCTYIPGHDLRWVLNDTYRDKNNIQRPHLFDVKTNTRIDLGEMILGDEYLTGTRFKEWRVDLHPRSSRSGKLVTIDSPYTGEGRQLHLIDISKIVG